MFLRTKGQRQILQVTIYVWHCQKKNDNRENSESSLNIKLNWNCFFFILQTFCFVQNLLNLTTLYGKRLICNWELSLRKQVSTKNKPIYRSLLSVHLTFFLFFYLLFEILHYCACCAVSFCVNCAIQKCQTKY